MNWNIFLGKNSQFVKQAKRSQHFYIVRRKTTEVVWITHSYKLNGHLKRTQPFEKLLIYPLTSNIVSATDEWNSLL